MSEYTGWDDPPYSDDNWTDLDHHFYTGNPDLPPPTKYESGTVYENYPAQRDPQHYAICKSQGRQILTDKSYNACNWNNQWTPSHLSYQDLKNIEAYAKHVGREGLNTDRPNANPDEWEEPYRSAWYAGEGSQVEAT